MRKEAEVFGYPVRFLLISTGASPFSTLQSGQDAARFRGSNIKRGCPERETICSTSHMRWWSVARCLLQ